MLTAFYVPVCHTVILKQSLGQWFPNVGHLRYSRVLPRLFRRFYNKFSKSH